MIMNHTDSENLATPAEMTEPEFLSSDEFAAQSAEPKSVCQVSETNFAETGSDCQVPSDEKQKRIATAQNFFDALYSNLPAQAHACIFTSSKDTHFYEVSNAQERATMAQAAISLNDNRHDDIWHSVNVFRQKPVSGRGKTAEVSFQTAVVCDIDVASPAHKSEKLTPDIETAKSFLPFEPSFLIDSGFGVHAYYLWKMPIEITADNREEIKRRNNRLIGLVRERADEYGGIDPVGDLTRVLRTPGTRNLKLGTSDAPLCKVLEASGKRFTPEEFDALLDELAQKTVSETPQLPADVTRETRPQPENAPSKNSLDDDPQYIQFSAELMISTIDPARLYYSEWLAVLSACKNIGVDYQTVDEFNRRDAARYSEKENLDSWKAIKDTSFDMRTLHGIAKRFGYSEKEARRQWYESHPEQSNRQAPPSGTTRAIISSCPIDLEIPSSCRFGRHGVGVVTIEREKPKFTAAAKNAIVPTKILREPSTNATAYEVAILAGGHWRHTQLDGEALFNSRKIIELANVGALIVRERVLSNYFAEFISYNETRIPEIKCYRRTGWTSADFKEFVYPSAQADYIVRRPNFDFDSVFKPRGNADAWKQKFGEVSVQGGAVARVVIGAALAATFVKPLEIPNLQVHVEGKSGIGKSSLPKFAVSIFGAPTAEGLCRTFSATAKNLVEVQAAFSDLPIFVDELELISPRERDKLPEQIYNYSLGIGNQAQRKDGTSRTVKKFSGTRLTAGESSILRTNDKKGAFKRILNLRCETLFENPFAAGLHRFCQKHYGLFGQQWIQFVIEHADEIRKQYDKMLAWADGQQVASGRKINPTQIQTICVALVAYQYFKATLGLQDKINGKECAADFRSIVATLPTDAELDDSNRAIEALSSFVAGNEAYFMQDGKENVNEFFFNANAREIFGLIKRNGEVAIFPHKFKEIVEKRLEFPSADKIIAEAYDKGLLITDPGRKQHQIRVGSKNQRFYHFKAGIISTAVNSAEQQSEAKTVCPCEG